MEWTREKRYLPYKDWDAETLLDLQAQAATSPYQMRYHLRPISGLVNDPNGFSYFNNEYHVFYQSYPFGAVHGLKSWVHFKSKDLVHWESLGLAVKPDSKGDSHGAYSGSAIQIGNELFLMYTGNHRDKNWIRTPYQIGAWMDKNGKVHNKQILFKNPNHITEHFRDPQIIKKDDHYYAILGAQDKANKHGHIDIWKSNNLKDWQEIGYLKFTDHTLGYMIECPNIINVDGKVVLIFCPQGLDKNVANYQNIYPNMYVIADGIDWEKAELINPSSIKNLDDGFDVYATQAFCSPTGDAYEISWVGLPDISYPTDNENWANALSQVKELHIKNGKLIQSPVKAVTTVHSETAPQTSKIDPKTNQYELKLTVKENSAGSIQLAGKNGLSINFDTKNGTLNLDRSTCGNPYAEKYGQVREVKLDPNKEINLDIFVDHSLIEIFVNEGEKVITGRFFSDPNQTKITLDKEVKNPKLWHLETVF